MENPGTISKMLYVERLSYGMYSGSVVDNLKACEQRFWLPDDMELMYEL